jgi:very-short-patch-repair endonuclease
VGTTSVDDCAQITVLRAAHTETEGRCRSLVDDSRAELGALADTLPLTSTRLDEAQSWVAAVRNEFGGPLRGSTARAILTTDQTPNALDDAFDKYEKAAASLFGVFAESHGSELYSEVHKSFSDGRNLLSTMSDSIADIDEWEQFVQARATLSARGWQPVVEAIEVNPAVQARDVPGALERAVLTRWTDEVTANDERLRPTRAIDRDRIMQEFRALDRAFVESAAAEVINTCSNRRPRSLAGEAGLIKQQSELKRRHKPVRRLFQEAAGAVQAVKPCFMMSPLSVSQFLPPGFKFDVVIFDEASQVREADAVGCIYRGSQLIVAGDPKQLPPTDFFSRLADDDDDEPDEELLDFESVLDRCKAQGLPELPLSWHYRSRHEALITFSNRSFYRGRLHTFPGANFNAPDLGVELFHVKGSYRRGSLRDNPDEAQKVVDRIVFHRRNHPNLTVGVVALSVAQQSAIEEAIERRTEPELRQLVTDNRLDGFFVKNLENVQGDERDLIILSIGYGPDENGKLTMNFGPMNRTGGERRLNVAVTRARRRVEVVTSVTAGDITSTATSILHLKRYLDFADRGPVALGLDIAEAGRDAESPFEEEVLRSVEMLGYEAVPQVGVAGYRIDIGVKHPTKPGQYVLGIECDGAMYHSSKVARDRDRLRQQVLEGLGWKIHRIWSTAWFSDRAAEEDRLRREIQILLEGEHQGRALEAGAGVEVEVDEFDFDDRPSWARAYQEPALEALYLHPNEPKFIDAISRPRISRQIQEVVRRHGPIHRDVVLETVRKAWGISRAGSRIQDAFDWALSHAYANGQIRLSGSSFLTAPEIEIVVRVPADEAAVPRRVAHVPPEELDLAIVRLLEDAGSSPMENVRTAWARLFGWRKVGSEIDIVFEEAVDRLRAAGAIDGDSVLRLR